MNNEDFPSFYNEVVEVLMNEHGYDQSVIECFKGDIFEAFQEGKGVSDVIFTVF